MNPHDLRALADAIVYRDSLAIARAADYLRACADALPAPAAPQAMEDANVWKQIVPDDEPQAEPKRPAFLDEIDRAKEHVASWPQWMKDATVSAAATLPVTEPKREPTGAVYGIIDPDYGRVYTIARKLAWEEGYAIGLHGSFTRDLDMIAVPWTDTACEPEHLIRRIVEATGLKLRDGVGVKPHGRRVWTLLFPAFGDPRFVDLSVMPRIGGSDAE